MSAKIVNFITTKWLGGIASLTELITFAVESLSSIEYIRGTREIPALCTRGNGSSNYTIEQFDQLNIYRSLPIV